MKPALHLVTVATCINPDLGYLLASAHANGLQVAVTGTGDRRMTPSMAKLDFRAKVDGARTWLSDKMRQGEIKSHDLILFTDGTDVILTEGEEGIINAWRRFGSPDLLISGEINLWPHKHLLKAFKEFAMLDGEADAPYIGLNAGVYIGRASSVEWMLSQHECREQRDDQGALQDIFVRQRRGTDPVTGIQHPSVVGSGLVWKMDRYHTFIASMIGYHESAIHAKRVPVLHFNGKHPKAAMPQRFATLFPSALHPKEMWAELAGAPARPLPASTPVNAAGGSKNSTAALTIAFSTILGAGVVGFVLYAVLLRKQTWKTRK